MHTSAMKVPGSPIGPIGTSVDNSSGLVNSSSNKSSSLYRDHFNMSNTSGLTGGELIGLSFGVCDGVSFI